MRKEAKIKALKHSLGDEYDIKTFKGHITIYKEIDENHQIKITNFKNMDHTVNICFSTKNENGYDLVNKIKFDVPFSKIQNTVEKLISNNS